MKVTHLFVAAATLFMLLVSGCEQGGYDPSESGLLVPKTVDEDSTLPSIFVNGTLLHSEAYGNPTDPMIVVLHGGPGSDYRYLLNCKEFAKQGYYVVFYDQRGSGLSKRHNADVYSIKIMYDDLTAVIAHYRTASSQKVFLLGHSWGAMLATAYINDTDNKIDGLVLGEPGGFIWQDILDYTGRSQSYKLTSESLNDSTYPDQFLTGKSSEHAILDYKFAVLAGVEDSKDSPIGNEGTLDGWRPGAVVNNAMFAIGRKEKPNWTTNLKKYTTKVIFFYSENNKAYGLEHAKKVSSVFPNVQLELTKGAGHDMLSFPTGWNNFYPVALTYLNSLK